LLSQMRSDTQVRIEKAVLDLFSRRDFHEVGLIDVARAAASPFDLLVLDAFSSDAVPVHLLSREAIRLYRSKLAEGGLLAFNLSNRYLDLDPVIGRQAEDAGLACRIRYDFDLTEEEKLAGKQPSIWAVLAGREQDLGAIRVDPRWRAPRELPGARVWTDDDSDLASHLILGWRGYPAPAKPAPTSVPPAPGP